MKEIGWVSNQEVIANEIELVCVELDMDECTHLQEPNISNQGLSLLTKYVCIVRTFRLMPPVPDTAVNKCYF